MHLAPKPCNGNAQMRVVPPPTLALPWPPMSTTATALGVVVREAHAIDRDGQPEVVSLEAQPDPDPAGPGVWECIG